MNPHALMFIQDLAIIMLVAGLITVICHRFKQPIVFGYIVAGIIVGPYTPPFSLISEEATVKILAELGVIFLMFTLGLEFNLRKLRKVCAASFIAAFTEISFMIFLGYEIGLLFNWSKTDSLFLGAIISISSTTIIAKALHELGLKHKRSSQLIFGILILEDVFAILILALLSSIAISGSLELKEVVITITKLSSFLVVSLLIGILLVPKLLTYIEKFHTPEMLLIAVLGLCFGFCLLVVKMQYSVALGAFIIGAIIAESRQLATIENLVTPIRDMFSAIFFVSVGLLFDPRLLMEYLVPISVITVAVLVGKSLSCGFGILMTERDGKTAMQAGLGLAQIGEFSFIIASLGISLKVTGEFLYSIAVAVSVITTLVTPYLIKHSHALVKYAKNLIPKKAVILLELYEAQMKNLQPEGDQIELLQGAKRCLIQVIVNLFIVIGVFLSGAYLAKTDVGGILIKITNLYIQKTIIWGIALVLALPFLIAAYRKIKILSVIFAEISVNNEIEPRLTIRVRRIISEIIPVLAIIGIMTFTFALSASILPPIELLVIILTVAAILIALLFPWLIKLHSKLKTNLIDSLKKEDE